MNETKRSFNVRKALLGLLALALVAAISVTATLAFLQKETNALTNTFVAMDNLLDSTNDPTNGYNQNTKGKFALFEHKLEGSAGNYQLSTSEMIYDGTQQDYSVIPGINVPKDPTVHVASTLTDVIVFVEIVEGGTGVWGNQDNQLGYEVTEDWTKVSGVTGNNGGTVYAYTPGKAGAGSTGQDCKIEPASTANGLDIKILKNDQITVGSNVTKTNVDGTNANLKFYAYLTQYAGFESQNLNAIVTGNSFGS